MSENLWLLAFAFSLGAIHALEPGHSKTVIAVWTVQNQGGFSRIFIMGFSAAFSHSVTIFILAFLIGLSFHHLPSTVYHHFFELISGLIILGIGIHLLWSNLKKKKNLHEPNCSCDHHHHDHDNSHIHDTEQKKSAKMAVLIGLTGGLIPCPSAIAALLTSQSAGNFAFGFFQVAMFSLGIAMTLIFVGILAQTTGNTFWKRYKNHALAQTIPVFSGSLIVAAGLFTLIKGVI